MRVLFKRRTERSKEPTPDPNDLTDARCRATFSYKLLPDGGKITAADVVADARSGVAFATCDVAGWFAEAARAIAADNSLIPADAADRPCPLRVEMLAVEGATVTSPDWLVNSGVDE